ncbi:MAG TPA: phosphotransferase, partial [Methylococcales bacterium]
MTVQVAETMARMHVLAANFEYPIPRSWPGTAIEMAEKRLQEFHQVATESLPSEVVSVIEKVESTYRNRLKSTDISALPVGAIHGDIMWENMKFMEGKLAGIFDFDDCRTSYFLEDIAKTLLFDFDSTERSMFGDNGEGVGVYLRAYDGIRRRSEAEVGALPLFLTARFLYQIASCATKIANGDTSLEPKLSAALARYNQDRSLF